MSPTNLPTARAAEFTQQTKFAWPVVVVLIAAAVAAGGAMTRSLATAAEVERHEMTDERRWQELHDDLKAIRSDVAKTREDVAGLRGSVRATQFAKEE